MYHFHKPRRPVTRVFIHCSASDHPDHDNAATMDRWHRERGWAGIGYHLFIRKSGLIETGRSLEKTPAAQRDHNRGTIAICLHGLKVGQFTTMQSKALVDLCVQINEAYDGKVTFHGHCEVATKACPVIDYRSLLQLDNEGHLGIWGSDETHPVKDRGAETNFGGPLRKGDTGFSVRMLQESLQKLGYYNGSVDGKFGRWTQAAVIAFQAANHLIEDGIVGSATYEALEECFREMAA